MSAMIDLAPAHLVTVRRLLSRHVPECEARAFGSRVAWTAKSHSDLDLAIVGPEKLPVSRLSRLREAFEESNLPMRVDLLDWHTISENFRTVILNRFEVLQPAAPKATPVLAFSKSNWRDGVLSDVVGVKHGYAFPGENIRDEPPGDILVTPDNFAIGGGFKADKFKYFNGIVPDEYVLREGDLVVTMTDFSKQPDTLGYPAIVPKSEGARFLHNQRIGKVLIKPGAEIDKHFLFYLLRTSEYRDEVLASATGTAIKHTSPGRVLAYRATIPPLAEQKAIAAVLGALDDKIELNRRMNATLEAMARALFQSWFVDFDPVRAKLDGRKPDGLDKATAALFPATFQDSPLGPIPQGWNVATLREISEVLSGGTPSKATGAYWNGTIPWISPQVMTGIHVNDSDDHVSEAAVGNGTRIVPKGAVLVMVRGMGLHQGVRISEAQRDVTFTQDVKAIVANTVPSTFLLYGLLRAAPMLLSKVHVSGHGTGVLSTEFLDHLSFTVPRFDALDALSQPLAALNSRIAANHSESRTLAMIRDMLLPSLLNGELSAGKINGER